MTLLGPINSLRLLEHQVMAKRALRLQPGFNCADFTIVSLSPGPPALTAGSLKKAQLNGFRNTASPLTLRSLAACSPSSAAQISDTVFFT